MPTTLSEQANRCYDDFRAMAASMKQAAESLRGRFVVLVQFSTGEKLPLLEPGVIDRKLGEYLERAKERQVKAWRRTGANLTDYASLVASSSQDVRQDAENRVSVSTWNAAKGPFLEALCLLADVVVRQSAGGPIPLCLFARTGPIRVTEDDRERFIWVRPRMVDTRSGFGACPDIVITTEPDIGVDTAVAIRECKCSQRIKTDEIRKECGKAMDLDVSSYVIVSYYKVSSRRREGAERLGLKIEELGLDGANRGAYVDGERNLVLDLATRLEMDDQVALFRNVRERGAALAKMKEASGK